MANRFEIEGRIVAHDEATVVIERAGQAMSKFSRDTRSQVAVAARETTQGFQAMTAGLLTQLNPALSEATSRFSMATREARQMTPAIGALTVAVAAAAVAGGAYLSWLKETSARQAELNIAIRGFNTEAI